MSFPIVFDVLMRTEIEARDIAEASKMIADDIAELGLQESVNLAFEIIRDDNAHPPKDVDSRHTNGFAIFTSAQKLDLVTKIAAALDAAEKGNRTPGNELLENLAKQFAYLDNRELRGVQA